MVDLNRSMRQRKPNGHSANICGGIKGEWTDKLTKKEMKELITLIARIGESSYRRGVQQGASFQEHRLLPEDLHDWRYNNCIDFSPPADAKRNPYLLHGMPFAIDRLFCEEYFHGFYKMGIYEPD